MTLGNQREHWIEIECIDSSKPTILSIILYKDDDLEKDNKSWAQIIC